MDERELAKMALDAAVGRIYQNLGVAPSKPLNAYIRAGLSVDKMPDGTPVVRATDPTSGKVYESVDQFASALKADPEFRPAITAARGSGGGESQVRRIKPEDMIEARIPLEDYATGRVTVDMPDPIAEVQFGDNEISCRDQKRINASIEKIARGEVTIADFAKT